MTRNIAIATLAAALLTGTASADTLREALVSTYNSNPTITSQRDVRYCRGVIPFSTIDACR